MRLVADQRILVEGDLLREDGAFIKASDESLALRPRHANAVREIRWIDVRKISRRAGRERVWAFPIVLGIVCGIAFGSCGYLLDSVDRSTSGHVTKPLGATAVAIGVAGGAVFGLLMMWAVPGPWWEPLYEMPAGRNAAGKQPLAERLAAGAVPDVVRKRLAARQNNKTIFAWVVLCAVMLGILGFCTNWQ
jgi:membrane associated rhomboid family serine protease